VEQRASFLGYGGLLTLYIKPGPETAAPVIEMPDFVKSLKVYDARMQDDIQAAYSLRDAFLKQSKEVFGEPFRNDPAYNGMLFILPLVSSESLLASMEEERAAWFSVFDAYFVESQQDFGLVLALKDPDFDEPLNDLLQNMREDGLVYRS
jgi:hypothetical protein